MNSKDGDLVISYLFDIVEDRFFENWMETSMKAFGYKISTSETDETRGIRKLVFNKG